MRNLAFIIAALAIAAPSMGVGLAFAQTPGPAA